jgi:hypothetical protein
MSGNGRNSSRVVLGALAAVVLLAGLWYTTSLRAQNAALLEQLDTYQRAAVDNERPPAPVAKSTAAQRAAATGEPMLQRMLSDAERGAMRSELSTQQGKQVWFETQANDQEAASFQLELEAVFLEAGWEVAGSSEAGYRVRAGVFMFMADDEPAAHVSAALRALEVAGLQVVAGAGYRAYYEKRKAEVPSFRGHEFAPGQAFVIVVGRNPDSAT